jgi:hypothetical protein
MSHHLHREDSVLQRDVAYDLRMRKFYGPAASMLDMEPGRDAQVVSVA